MNSSVDKAPAKVVGFAVCPVGPLAGHDADESRANAMSDGSVLCVSCGTSYPGGLTLSVRQSIAALMRAGFHRTHITTGSAIQPDKFVPGSSRALAHVLAVSPYDASCLSGYDPATFKMVRVLSSTSIPGGPHAELSCNGDDLEAAENPVLNFGRQASADDLAPFPAQIVNAVRLLEKVQYRLCSINSGGSLRFITMARGRTVGSMGYVQGISVQLSAHA